MTYGVGSRHAAPHSLKGAMDDSVIPRFGTRAPGQEYVERPSAYGVVRDRDGCIAALRTRIGVFLPGGGLDSDEPPERGVVREMREECGFVVRVLRALGVADELLYAEAEQTHYSIRSAFFAVEIVELVSPIEPDHELVWLPVDVARLELTRGSQRWVVTEKVV